MIFTVYPCLLAIACRTSDLHAGKSVRIWTWLGHCVYVGRVTSHLRETHGYKRMSKLFLNPT